MNISNIELIKYNNNKISIHPIFNIIDSIDPGYFTLPYNDSDNNLEFKLLSEKNNLNFKTDLLNYFIMPINSSNFLDVIFNINSIDKLDQWLNESKNININIITEVLDIFWKNNYMNFDKDFDKVINLNRTIFLLILKTKISEKELLEITEDFIKNNYSKKINYLNELKKYLSI